MALAGSQPLRAAPTAATTTPFLKTAPSLLMTVISKLGAVFTFLMAGLHYLGYHRHGQIEAPPYRYNNV